MSTLGDIHAHQLTLHVPNAGAWRADVVLEKGAVPTGTDVLTVGDLALSGAVLRAADDAPERPHAVVQGGIGWDRAMPEPLSHDSDGGVRLFTVLKDLARVAGEPIEQPMDRIIGDHYASPAGLVRDALAALVHAGFVDSWRVDVDGVTRFGLRQGTEVTARATVLRKNAAIGMTVLGIDSPSAFLPGNTLEGQTIERLIVTETSGKLIAEVWTGASLRTLLLRQVRNGFPQLIYGYPRTYVVAKVGSDGRVDLVPPPDAPELPELLAVEQWGLGQTISPPEGARALVVFCDANPTRPVIVGWQAGEGTETIPAGTEARRALCWGDVVTMPTGSAATPLGVKLVPAVSVGAPPAPPATPIQVSRVKV